MGEQRQTRPSRRTVLTGIGAAGGAGLLAGATAVTARAAGGPGHNAASALPATPPAGLHTIASPPEGRVSYQFRSFLDFMPSDTLSAGRQWGGLGEYTPGSLDNLATTIDAPAGAALHDVEWYVSNTAAANWGVGLWAAGTGPFVHILDGTLPAGTGAITASKFAIPSTTNGPYPFGTRLLVWIYTSVNGSVQVNGVRLGLVHGALSQVMRETPVRVYDSRSHTHLIGGASRTISLANWLPADAQAATLSLTVLNTHGAGSLHVSPAGPSNSAFAVSWARTGDRETNTLVSNVSLPRAVTVTSNPGSGTTDFILELIGWVV